MVGICLNSNAVVILNFHQKLYAEAQLWSRFFFSFWNQKGWFSFDGCLLTTECVSYFLFLSSVSRLFFYSWGAFYYYVDQNLPNFDLLPLSSAHSEHFTCCISFVHVTKCGLSTYHLPTFLCQHSYWMTPMCRSRTYQFSYCGF